MSDSSFIAEATERDFEARVLRPSFEVPVLVDFWADWCAPCRALAPVLTALAEAYQGAFLLVKVNTDEQQALAQHYSVRSLPTVKVFRNGEVVEEFMGAQPEAVVREILDRHVERHSDKLRAEAAALHQAGELEAALATLRGALQEDPDNTRIHADLVPLLLEAGALDEAEEVMKKVPVDKGVEPEFKALAARIEFARDTEQGVDAETLEARVEADPADLDSRYQLAVQYVSASQYEEALEQFLEIMRRDRGFRDDAGRKGMLSVFQLLDNGGPLVSRYRSLMSAVLY
ncbi:MAG: thioredoxin [Gammaproteobacteria bacterium]|nr:thioredoxin [Gammaproteobacteria bacterium]